MMNQCLKLTVTAWLFGWPLLLSAAVNDIFPTDYVARPDGTLTSALYAYDRRSEGPYVKGKKVLDGTASSQIAALRLSKFVYAGSTPVAFLAVLPWADTKVLPTSLGNLIGKNAQGFGDLRLGATVFLVNDTAHHEYFGITAVSILPTGSYDVNQTLNIGENRWRFVLGAGWNKPLRGKFVLELSPEIAFSGDNDRYLRDHRLEQNTAFALSGILRYRYSPTFHVFGGAQVNSGGTTHIDGIAQHNPPDNNRINFGALYITKDLQLWTLRYSRDTSIKNGFRTEDELALRWQKSF